MARTDATFKAVNRNGRELGTRRRRKMAASPAAYERISSIDSAGTDVNPRRVLTRTGKKQRTAAITIFDHGLRIPNQAFVIGANAMIGIALAAIRYGISALPSGPQRARTSAARNA